MVERHNILEPPDLMLAQYSIPFCVALALYREARDPECYDEGALADPRIRALVAGVRLVAGARDGEHGGATVDGDARPTAAASKRHAEGGMLEPGELADKFTRLTRGTIGEAAGRRLLERLRGLEDEPNLDWLGA